MSNSKRKSSIELLRVISMFMIYPVMGHLLSKEDLERRYKCFIIVMGIISVISGVITSLEYTRYSRWSQVGLEQYTFFIALSAFLICKKLNKFLEKGIIRKILIIVGKCTFGIYLLDPIINRFIMWKVVDVLINYIPTIFATVIGCCAAILIGTVIVYALKKIPYVKKIL